MKGVAEDRTCFDVVSYNRTYHFQVSHEWNIGFDKILFEF